MSKKMIGVVVVLGVFIMVWLFMSRAEAPTTASDTLPPAGTPTTTEMTFSFTATDGSRATISYPQAGAEVAVVTVAGNPYMLKQVRSGSGIRFESADGSVVYTEHQGAATVSLNGEIVVDEAAVADTTTLPESCGIDDDCDGVDMVAGDPIPDIDITVSQESVTTLDGLTQEYNGGTITFTEDRYQVNFGCNNIGGTYTLEDGYAVLGMGMTTMMGCPDDIAEKEQAFQEQLDNQHNRIYIKIAGVEGEAKQSATLE